MRSQRGFERPVAFADAEADELHQVVQSFNLLAENWIPAAGGDQAVQFQVETMAGFLVMRRIAWWDVRQQPLHPLEIFTGEPPAREFGGEPFERFADLEDLADLRRAESADDRV